MYYKDQFGRTFYVAQGLGQVPGTPEPRPGFFSNFTRGLGQGFGQGAGIALAITIFGMIAARGIKSEIKEATR